MNVTRFTHFPALSDPLRQANIDPVALMEALEQYALDVANFIELNFDRYERPLEYLKASDYQRTITSFIALVPRLCSESDQRVPLDQDLLGDDDEGFSDAFDDAFDDE